MEAIPTSKGQITLPKPLRERLHLNTGDRVELLLGDDGRVALVPTSAPVTRLKGMVPPRARPVTLEQIDNALAGRAGRGCLDSIPTSSFVASFRMMPRKPLPPPHGSKAGAWTVGFQPRL